MKTLLLTTLLALSGVLNAHNGTNDSLSADREVRRAIERHIQSPKAEDGQSVYGAALIEFGVNCRGEIDLYAAEATSDALLNYIKSKLNTLKISKGDASKVYTFRLIFKPEQGAYRR